IIHPYYMVALAPAIGALIGVGATVLWQARVGWAGRVTAALAVGGTAWGSFELLDRTPNWLPWLRVGVLAAGAIGVGALLAGGVIGTRLPGVGANRTVAAVATGAALVAGLAGPIAYTVDTVSTAHTGSLPSAGPATTGAFGGPGGAGGGG